MFKLNCHPNSHTEYSLFCCVGSINFSWR